jgi:tetratricopeptide (TPR) repeat protein
MFKTASAEELYEKGCLFQGMGLLNAAIDYFRQSMTLCSDDPTLLKKIGEQFFAADQYALSEECMRRALALRPRDADTWLALAKVLRAKGDFLEARIAAIYARRFKIPLESALWQTLGLVFNSHVEDLDLTK